MSSSPTACCPRCDSNSVQAVPIPKKNVGAAVLNELAFGTAAGVTEGVEMVIQVVCLSCGTQWIPGTQAEHRLRALHGQLGETARRKAEAEIAEEVRAAERKKQHENTQAWVGCGGCLLLLLLGLLGGACSAVRLIQ